MKLHTYTFLFLVPAIILIVATGLFPLVQSLALSFLNVKLGLPYTLRFIGFDNYIKVLNDSRFIADLLRTYLYASVCCSLQLCLGLITALALTFKSVSQRTRTIGLTILISPLLFPYVAVGLIFLLIFNTDFGIINYVLKSVFGFFVNWFGQPNTAFLSVVIMDSWQNVPFVTIMLVAAILSIPTDFYEAAEIDGAGSIHKFRYITLPFITPAIYFAALFRFLGALKMWDYIAVTTYGGPGTATEVVTWYLTYAAFRKYYICLLYTSPSPRDLSTSRMPSSA